MATRIVVPMSPAEGEAYGRSTQFFVQESYDEILERMAPLTPPTSALEHRMTLTFTLTNGNRLYLHPKDIMWIEENAEEPDDSY